MGNVIGAVKCDVKIVLQNITVFWCTPKTAVLFAIQLSEQTTADQVNYERNLFCSLLYFLNVQYKQNTISYVKHTTFGAEMPFH